MPFQCAVRRSQLPVVPMLLILHVHAWANYHVWPGKTTPSIEVHRNRNSIAGFHRRVFRGGDKPTFAGSRRIFKQGAVPGLGIEIHPDLIITKSIPPGDIFLPVQRGPQPRIPCYHTRNIPLTNVPITGGRSPKFARRGCLRIFIDTNPIDGIRKISPGCFLVEKGVKLGLVSGK